MEALGPTQRRYPAELRERAVRMVRETIRETVFEPRVGGHIFDGGSDGSECHWARVLVYEPPDRVVFSWDISPQW